MSDPAKSKRHTVPSGQLPFVKFSRNNVNYWNVPTVGDFVDGCETGEALAKSYLRFLREEKTCGGGYLQLIATDMFRQRDKLRMTGNAAAEAVDGQIVGFLSVLDKWLVRAAIASRTKPGEPCVNSVACNQTETTG
ncbi:hypothetical protein EB241_16545 [Erwinia psidii]|uniref:Uncharacterized protein n=1 Tax=Erwinia psidii TaxID=69224 RepID=A0A3N6S821_9GAMM|nr:hypothetical protein EB241_16545 [Erwinia psidii]